MTSESQVAVPWDQSEPHSRSASEASPIHLGLCTICPRAGPQPQLCVSRACQSFLSSGSSEPVLTEAPPPSPLET